MKLTESQTEQVIKAFMDIMNAVSYIEIKKITGLPVSRCVEIYNLSKDILNYQMRLAKGVTKHDT